MDQCTNRSVVAQLWLALKPEKAAFARMIKFSMMAYAFRPKIVRASLMEKCSLLEPKLQEIVIDVCAREDSGSARKIFAMRDAQVMEIHIIKLLMAENMDSWANVLTI